MWTQIERLIKLSNRPLPNEVDPLKNPERRNYYRFLYHLMNWREPFVALEIGAEAGLASLYMAMAARNFGGHVITIDYNKPGYQANSNYTFIAGDSTNIRTWTAVKKLVEKHGKIGIVYQDSSHHYEASCQEFELYRQFLADEAIWICDDITSDFFDPLVDPPGKGMVQYFEELSGDKRLFKDVLHRGNTQGIVIL